MNKAELVKKISEKSGVPKYKVLEVVDAFKDVVRESVAEDEKISITGFISFEKRHLKEKSGVSKLGDAEKSWTVPAHDEIAVKLSKGYKTFE